jgi:hypothetical protein
MPDMTHHFAYPHITEIRRGQAPRTARRPAGAEQHIGQRDLVRASLLCVEEDREDRASEETTW